MLIISKELRNQINAFLGGVQVPVSVAPNFLAVIKALSELKELKETKDADTA